MRASFQVLSAPATASHARNETEEGDTQPLVLEPGSYVHIPASRRQRGEWTDPAVPTVSLAIHYQ